MSLCGLTSPCGLTSLCGMTSPVWADVTVWADVAVWVTNHIEPQLSNPGPHVRGELGLAWRLELRGVVSYYSIP